MTARHLVTLVAACALVGAAPPEPAPQDTAAAARAPRAHARAAQVPRRPDVTKRPADSAASILRRLGVALVRRDSVVPGGVDGIVLRQIPGAGTVIPPRSTDTLVVARVVHVRRLPVPNVTGRPLREGLAILLRAGLRGDGPTLSSPDSANATITAQKPVFGDSLPPRGEVALQVAVSQVIVMPHLIGLPVNQALQWLRRLPVATPQVTRAPHSTIPSGLVSAQVPDSGRPVNPSTGVQLTLSTGPVAVPVPPPPPPPPPIPPPPPVPPPPPPVPPPTPVPPPPPPIPPPAPVPPPPPPPQPAPDPPPVVSVRATVVRLITMPSVFDSTRPGAIEVLRQVGILRVQPDTTALRPLPPGAQVSWTVAHQVPAAGDAVEPTTLAILRLQPAITVPVPPVTGLDLFRARTAADAAGLVLVQEAADRRPRLWGTRVVRQNPDPTTLAPLDSPLTVSIHYPVPAPVVIGGGLLALVVLVAVPRPLRHRIRQKFGPTVRIDPKSVRGEVRVPPGESGIRAHLTWDAIVTTGAAMPTDEPGHFILREELIDA